ncbi:sugar efflux transporter [compost metagenome]
MLPGLQIRIMNLGKDAPALASTSNHSALNLGNAFGAFFGGAIITNVGLSYLPWFGALFSFLGLLLAGAVYMWDIKDGKRVANH